jgi:hypothetical protein
MRRGIWAAMAITAVTAVAFLAAHRLDVFWTTDGGNRFIQVQQLARSGELPIEYPGVPLDPAFTFAPTGGHHFVIRDTRLHSFYTTTFPLLVAPLYRLFGLPGLYLIPLLAMIATIPLLGLLSRALGSTDWPVASAVALVFATPLFFYTVSFWEHTLALALTTAGVLLATRRSPAFGGALIALGAAFREESYIALAAVGAALMADRRVREAVVLFAAAIAVLSPLWLANWVQYSHPLGLHSAVYEAIGGGIAEKVWNFWIYLFAFTRQPVVRVGLAVPAILLALIALMKPSPRVQRARVILLYATAAGAVAAAVTLITSPQPLNEAFRTQSLFGSIPFAVSFFAVARELPRFLSVLIGTSLVLTCAALHQGDIGLIWGPRHFLWLVPFLVIATAMAVRLLPATARAAIAILVIAAFAIHAQGIRLLSQKLRFSAELLQTIEASDAKVVVTDVFWVPEELAALWFKKPMFLVKSDQELAGIIERLQKAGIRRMDFVAAAQFHLVSPAGYAALLERTRRGIRIGRDQPMIIEVLHTELPPVPPREAER